MNTSPARSASGLAAMVVRPPVSPVTRVVVRVDGSAGSAAALRWAAAEACRRQVLLRIVSAWQEPERSGGPVAVDPARIAAERVQKALARVFFRQHVPRRIGCATPKGAPGEALLNETAYNDLLVLGAVGAMHPPGPTGQYCLRHGRGPLVFVPAPARRDLSDHLVGQAQVGRDMGSSAARSPSPPRAVSSLSQATATPEALKAELDKLEFLRRHGTDTLNLSR